ncbi:hypothetical protein RIE95_05935 [Acidithiobacillus thiooxidans]|uniref:hypothetical protein n=1 Tax=Acidithiobacillus thiooxidans TaxID=930 RepID=UPI00285DD4A8|nr:hypothetical protein [Acidithiobacillus thiooxidans]MDR7926532.1 hypothetical protein [Acidithiobacillus thiooxidans]
MQIETVWKAGKARKLESKKSSWTGYIQPVTVFPFGGGPLNFDVMFQDGEKLFQDTQNKTRIGMIELAASDRGDLRLLPASSGELITIDKVNERITSGECFVVDVQAWAPEFRASGSYEDRSWEDCFIQSLTVLDKDLWPTDLTLRNYVDFEADVLPHGVYHASFQLTSRRHSGRSYPSFRLDDVVPIKKQSDLLQVNG